jgi:hypothetical protein
MAIFSPSSRHGALMASWIDALCLYFAIRSPFSCHGEMLFKVFFVFLLCLVS